MFATVRRYEGVDVSRTDELTEKVNDTLMPRLSKLPGFGGYYLIEARDGVVTSLSLFETAAQADESSNLVRDWVQEAELEKVLPNAPKITTGEVIAHHTPNRAMAAV
jgi:hypothetical protein